MIEGEGAHKKPPLQRRAEGAAERRERAGINAKCGKGKVQMHTEE